MYSGRGGANISDTKSDIDDGVSVYEDTGTLLRDKGEGGFTTKWGPRGYDRTNHCLNILVSDTCYSDLCSQYILTMCIMCMYNYYNVCVYL